jgi:CHAT domain-containing protein
MRFFGLDPVSRLVARLYRLCRVDDVAGFSRDVADHLDQFQRHNLQRLQDELSRRARDGPAAAAPLERMGDYFLEELLEGPVGIFRDVAVHAYRAALGVTADKGKLLFKLGAACLQRLNSDREENVLEARRYLEQSLTNLPPSDDVTRGLVYCSLGVAYSEAPFSEGCSDRDRAVKYFQEALRSFSHIETQPAKAMVLLNLGNLLGTSDPDRALGYYRDARAIYIDLHQWENVAQVEQNLGLTLLEVQKGDRTENVEQAVTFCRTSLTRLSKDKRPYDYAVGLQNLGQALAHRVRGTSESNFREAICVFREAGEIFERVENRFAARAAFTGEGGMHYELGEWDEASRAFDRAITLLESDWSEHATAQSRQRLARTQAQLFDFAVLAACKAGQTETALEMLERGRNRVLAGAYFARNDTPRHSTFLDDRWQQFQSLGNERATLERELTHARMQPTGDISETHRSMLNRQLDRCRLRQDKIAHEIRRNNPDFLPLARPAHIQEIRQAASDLDATIWVLRPTSKGTLLFAVAPGREIRQDLIKQVTTETLQTLLLSPGGMLYAYDAMKEARQMGLPAFAVRQQQWLRSITSVLDVLQETVIKRCIALADPSRSTNADSGRPKLFILAGGLLDLVPLHATFTEINGTRRYLMDVADVAYFTSFHLLWRSLENSRRSRVERLFAVESGANDLDYDKWELSVAQKFFPSSLRFIIDNPDGFETLVRQRKWETSMLLISCHAESHTREALRSGLFFKPQSVQPDYPLVNLLGADLPRLPLVLLNACETSLAEFHDPADECLSLANAFIAAGAGAVIGTQWEASDVAAALWCARFLQHFSSGRGDALGASSAASRWIRDSPVSEKKRFLELHPLTLPHHYLEDLDQDFGHPYFWANHRFHGVGVRLDRTRVPSRFHESSSEEYWHRIPVAG